MLYILVSVFFSQVMILHTYHIELITRPQIQSPTKYVLCITGRSAIYHRARPRYSNYQQLRRRGNRLKHAQPVASPSASESAEHQCNVCGRQYKYRNNLLSHKRNECGKEPCYMCPFCKRQYRFKGSLTKHIQRVH